MCIIVIGPANHGDDLDVNAPKMADDIDIEEHDVLDNPQLRNIFPDLSRIKEEVIELDQEENQNEEIYEPYPSDFNESEHSLQISEPYHDPATYVEDTEEYPRHQNKIILGSKPSGESLNIKVEREDILEPKCLSPNTSAEESPTLRNLLMIGSKSAYNTTDHLSDTDDDEEEIRPLTVLLEDWGPRLEASKCFCKDCEILFPTRNALDAHKMAAHSFLVALDANKAVKSTAKDFRGPAATPGSFSGDHVAGTSKFCNHCNKTFANDTVLISHLYQILTSGMPNSKMAQTNKEPKVLETKVLESPDMSIKLLLRCNICGIYFKNQIYYEKHVINGHGVTSPNLNRGPYNGNCWFCPALLSNRENYNKHVLRSHPKYYYNKKFSNFSQKSFLTASETSCVQANPKPGSQISPAVKYQCSKCCEIFPDYIAARYHRNTKHPELKNLYILNKLPTKKNTPSFTIKKSKPVNNPQQIDFPIPIKILYQCEKCEIHFTNCTAGIQHSKNCKKTKGDWECHQCHRVFRVIDKDVHIKQHIISKNRFYVHICNEDLYHRVINRCPKCRLYFHEKEFIVHYRNGCLKSSSVDCFRCNISFESSCIKTHNSFHEKYDFGIHNLILVEFLPKIVDISLKRKLECKEVVAKKPRLKCDKVILYYCSHCKCSMLSKRYFDLHSQGNCVNILSGKKHICKICGIMVSSKRHSEFHERNKNWKLSNFTFMNLHDRKVINPPVPDYPTCEKCGVRVIQSSALENHECGANYKSCWYCKKKFTDLAYLLHVRLHSKNVIKSDISEEELKEIVPKAPTRTSFVQNQMPELLKKYEMLTETWNILYLCRTCDIIHDTYDSTVEHCQNHFNKMESYDVTIRRCQTCDLKFDSKCFEKHKSLHSLNKGIRKESFHILYYSYEDLLSPKWLDIFQSLPDEQSQHILQQSIYKNSRNFKMTVIADGSPEYTLYICGNCDIYSPSFDFMSHVDCSKEHRRYHCRVCNLPFNAHSVRDAHETEHKKTENFRIVLFNSPDDSNFNKALTDDKTQSKNFSKPPKESMVHYYRCTNCKCCIKRKECTKTHECYGIANRKFCGRCGLTFWRAAIAPHALLHRTNPYCTREHIQLTDFNPRSSLKTSNLDDKTAKLYKCSCGLHFISSKTIEKHLNICGNDIDVAKENCSKCNLLFDTHELFNHLCRHHSSDKYIKFDVEDVTSKKRKANKDPFETLERNRVKMSGRDHTKALYKCKKCDIYCMSVNALKYHYLYTKHQTNNAAKCKLCGLRFSSTSLKKHVKLHHVKYRYKLKDFQVIIIDYKPGVNGTLQVSNKWYHDPVKVNKSYGKVTEYTMSKKFLSTLNLKFYSKKIFKCSNCPLHFLSTQTLYSHKNNQDGRFCNSNNRGVKCNVCGFNFSVYTLPRHKYIHHDKMKLQNVVSISDPFDGHTRKPQSIKRGVNLKKNSPVKEITNSELIRRAKAIKGLDKNDYDNTLYKCEICDIHFLSVYSVKGHFVKKKHNLYKIQCKFCGFFFTEQSLVRHIYVHHLKMKLKRKDFKIIVKDCNFGLAYEDEHNTAQRDDQVSESDEQVTEADEQDNECQEDTCKVIENVKDNELSKRELATLVLDKYSSRIYKCGLCDAHFLRPKTLLTHYLANRHIDETSICNICGLSFTPKTVRIHKHVQHDIMKLKKHDLQVVNVGKKSVVIGSQIYDENIYKCVVCDLYFFHIVSADHHLVTFNGAHENTGIKCDDCGLRFSHKALKPHKKIHHQRMKLKLEDFKINLIGTNIDSTNRKETDNRSVNDIEYNSQNTDNDDPALDDISESTERTSLNSEQTSYPYNDGVRLYKCTLCSVHFFTESTVESHYHKLRGKVHQIATATCSQCNLTFSRKILSRHQDEHHEKMKLEAKDFQIVPFSEYDDNYFGNNYLYRCSVCKSHFIRESSLENHYNSQNHSTDKIKCIVCKFKFVKLGYYSHISPFHRYMKLRRQDVKVWESVDGKLVPIDVNDDDEEEVPVKDPFDNESDSEKLMLAETDHEKTTLNLDNYDSTIFKCGKCPLHFITMMSAKKHSACRKDTSNTSGTCPKCGLIFGPVTLPKHMYIHHELHQLNKEDFRIIERPTPNAEKSNDVQTTIERPQMEIRYKSEQKFARQSLESNNTIYRCNKCNLHFLTFVSFSKHDHHVVFKSKCLECGLTFTNRSITRHKAIHHDKLKLKLVDFKIIDGTGDKIDVSSIDSELTRDTDLESVASRFDVDLNDSSDATDLLAETSSVSTNISEHGVKLRPRRSNASGPNKSMIDTDDIYDETIYRCEICDTCFMDNRNIASHFAKCTRKIVKLECDVCNLSFSIKIIGKHKIVHHERLKLSRDDFKIITIGETIAKEKERSSIDTETVSDLSTLDKSLYNNELFKCSKCNIHFVGQNDFQVHMKSKCHEISKYHCTFCTLPFSLRALPIHVFIHHEKMKLNTEHFFIITDTDADQNIVSHLSDSPNQKNTNLINPSSLSGFQDSGLTDKPKDTSIPSKVNTDYSIVQSSSDWDSSADTSEILEMEHTGENETKSNVSTVKLYKCGDCNVYYLTQATCYKHMLNHKQLDSIEYIECKICGFQFRILSLHKHIMKHHNKEFKLENVLVEEYLSNENGAPTLDIYFANYKLQSRLVSTTSERCTVTSAKNYDVSSIGSGNATCTKPCTITSKDCIETDSTECINTCIDTQNEQEKHNQADKSENISAEKIENMSEHKEPETDIAEVASMKSVQTSVKTDRDIDRINVNNVSIDTNNDEIKEIEDKEFEEMSSEIENMITYGRSINNTIENTDVNAQVIQSKLINETDSIYTKTLTSNVEIIYIIEDDEDVHTNSVKENVPDVGNNEIYPTTANDNLVVSENKTGGKSMVMDDNLNIDNLESENEYLPDNALLTERLIIDLSDEENQLDIDNLGMEINKNNVTNIFDTTKHDDIIEIE